MAFDRDQRRLIRTIDFELPVNTVAWSPDGRLLATGDDEWAVTVWTREGRQVWRGEGHSRLVWNVAWSPDGRWLASGSADTTIRIWDAASGAVCEHLQGHSGSVHTLSWSPDGTWLASGSIDQTIALWEIARFSLATRLEGHSGTVREVAWSPDSRSLASASYDDSVRVWDVGRRAEIARSDAHGCYAVAWSPEGRRLATAGDDPTIRIWDADLVSERARLEGHSDFVYSIAWSPDGNRLASSGHDGTIRVWEARTGAELEQLGYHGNRVWSIALSRGVIASASQDATVALWDVRDLLGGDVPEVASGKAMGWLARQAATVGRRAAVPVAAAPWVPRHLPSDGTRGLLGTVADSAEKPLDGVAISPDGRRVAVPAFFEGSRRIRCWSLEDGAMLWQSEASHTDTIWRLAWSPDGRRIASASQDGTFKVWDAATGALRSGSGVGTDIIRSCAWSPDGRRLATVGRTDDGLRIWDGETGTELKRFPGGALFGVAWSPDGHSLADGFDFVRVVDAETGVERVRSVVGAYINSLAWSPDGSVIASAGDNHAVTLWDVTTGRELRRFDGHTSSVKYVAWSPDGRHLASGSIDRTVRIWDAETTREMECFPGRGGCWQVAWAPSGAFLVSCHDSETVRVWDTRFLLGPPAVSTPIPTPLAEPPAELRPLPAILAGLHRLDIYPPLSLVRDLHQALGADPPAAESGAEPWTSPRRAPGLQRLRDLRWPAAAHTGLIALLLHGLPAEDWSPPSDLPTERIAATLAAALAGEAIPAQAPPPPLGFLATAAARVDDRVMTLLTALGPREVIKDPGLPLRLLPEVARLPRLDDAGRRLLGARLTALDAGAAQGEGPSSERAGISPRGPLTAVLASQHALPRPLFDDRALNGGLLYRARTGHAPPRLRPMVLVLDVSPAAFGPVEAMTRPAAHAIARTLRAAGLPVALVTAGGAGTARLADSATAALAVLTERSLKLADAVRAMAKAETLRRSLAGYGAEPLVLLLAHPWFGAEEPEAVVPPGLRALFIQYPGPPVRPAWAERCARHETLPPKAWARLPDALGRLIG